MTRRQAFVAATVALGIPLGQAATQLGVTYTHLTPVLDGARRGSASLEAGIRALFDAARPELAKIIAGAYDAPLADPSAGARERGG